MIVKQEDLSYLLNTANDFRAAMEGEKLDELPKGIPQDASQCIVAKAFNYGCKVYPEEGVIEFESREDAETYLKVVTFTEEETGFILDFYELNSLSDFPIEGLMTPGFFTCPAKSEFCNIAEAFDHGELLNLVDKESFINETGVVNVNGFYKQAKEQLSVEGYMS